MVKLCRVVLQHSKCLTPQQIFQSNWICHLRIDNSRRGRIHNLWHISRTTKATTSCVISNERTDFSACVDISSF